jgi:hypothetical protein
MVVHVITERLTKEELDKREATAFANMYKAPRSAFTALATIQLWHKQRIHDRILDPSLNPEAWGLRKNDC